MHVGGGTFKLIMPGQLQTTNGQSRARSGSQISTPSTFQLKILFAINDGHKRL